MYEALSMELLHSYVILLFILLCDNKDIPLLWDKISLCHLLFFLVCLFFILLPAQPTLLLVPF